MRRKLATLTVALAVVLAGCAGGVGSGGAGTVTDSGATTQSGTTASGSGTGTVNFYVSDRPAAIESFEHLNVTISKVGFHAAGDETESESENETDENDENDGGDGTWVTRDVDNVTVDLTELQGANATLLEEFELPNGTYDTTFVYASDVNGTLTSGESVNVKLPSEKLQIRSPMTVGDGSEVDFVFDIAVHEAGTSGKYILQPVVSESGTDVEIEEVERRDRDDVRRDGAEEGREEETAALNLSVAGNVTPGESVTLTVRDANGTVANATVVVNDETVGATGTDGTIAVTVPDAEELSVEVTVGGREAELEREFENYASDS